MSVPSATQAGHGVSRSMSERARRVTVAMTAARSLPVEKNVAKELSKGARVFRIQEVTVIDPTSNRTYNVPRDQVHQSAGGLLLFEGAAQVQLSKQAKIVGANHYGYIFRRGSERDPDSSLHAERVK
jgi:hypothetical protein